MPSRRIIPLLVIVFIVSCPIVRIKWFHDDDGNGNQMIDFSSEESKEIQFNLSGISGWFTENIGQIENPEIRFVNVGSNCTIGLIESGYLIKLTNEENLTSMVEVSFVETNSVVPKGINELSHKSNFFRGNDCSKWITEVTNYREVVYEDLYYGIDLVFHSTENGLKYDFIVSPDADPTEISIAYEGTDGKYIDERGNLHIKTPSGELVEEAPFSYQMIDGEQIEVGSSFLMEREMVCFCIGDYDRSMQLIIDPLIYSTFIGGSEDFDIAGAIVLDSENNVYVAGGTESTDFPTTPGCYDDSHEGNNERDAFVLKLSSDGSSLLFSTFIGGADFDAVLTIELDADNIIYIAGQTYSEDFPTTDGCYDDSYYNDGDIFVCKMSSDGSQLLYSTFVGGHAYEYPSGLCLDHEKNVFVTGHTVSGTFPTTNGCYDNESKGIFVFKLNKDGSNLDYSTFIGIGVMEDGSSMVLDADNNAYVVATTKSLDFPTTEGCYDEEHNGGRDVVVSKLNSDGSDLIYSTFVGGSDNEKLSGGGNYHIELDTMNNAYVTGNTESSDFPTTEDCWDDSYNGGNYGGDVFVFKLNSNGSDLIYSTFIGGSDDEGGLGIIVDVEYNAYVTGWTKSTTFPTTEGCHDDTHNGNNESGPGGDVFVLKLNPNGSDLLYSTFVGGEDSEKGLGIAMDDGNNVYITGYTVSYDFPTTPDCYDDTYNGGSFGDAYVFKLNLFEPIASIESVFPISPNEGETVRFVGNGTDDGFIEAYQWNSSIDGYLSDQQSFIISNLSNGTHVINFRVKDNNTWSDFVQTIVTVNGIPRAFIHEISPTNVNEGETINFSGSGNDDGSIEEYQWNSSIDGYLSDEAIFSTAQLSPGSHIISFRVKDDNKHWSPWVFEAVFINAIPSPIINLISPNPSLLGQSITFVGSGIDADGIIEGYLWYIDGVEFSRESVLIISNLTIGSHLIELKVQDNFTAWSDFTSDNITILAPPSAQILSISPNPAIENQTVDFSGSGTDLDGIIVSYEWKLDSVLVATTESFTTSDLTVGTYNITFRVKDNDNLWSSLIEDNLTINEPRNQQPTAKIESIYPNPSTIGQTITVTGSGTDIDGIVVKYEWNVNGVLVSTDESFTTADLQAGTHTVEFQVQDDDGEWSDVVSSTINIEEAQVEKDDNGGFISGFGVIVIFVAISLSSMLYLKKRL